MKFLTTGQAAKLLDVHISSVNRAIKRGEISYTRYGANGWKRITLEDLEKYAGRKLSNGEGE